MIVGLATTGVPEIEEAIAGLESCVATFPGGGAATTGPDGGLAEIAGADTTMRGSCRGCGTILRGAGLAS